MTGGLTLLTNDGLLGYQRVGGPDGTTLVPDLAAAYPRGVRRRPVVPVPAPAGDHVLDRCDRSVRATSSGPSSERRPSTAPTAVSARSSGPRTAETRSRVTSGKASSRTTTPGPSPSTSPDATRSSCTPWRAWRPRSSRRTRRSASRRPRCRRRGPTCSSGSTRTASSSFETRASSGLVHGGAARGLSGRDRVVARARRLGPVGARRGRRGGSRGRVTAALSRARVHAPGDEVPGPAPRGPGHKVVRRGHEHDGPAVRRSGCPARGQPCDRPAGGARRLRRPDPGPDHVPGHAADLARLQAVLPVHREPRCERRMAGGRTSTARAGSSTKRARPARGSPCTAPRATATRGGRVHGRPAQSARLQGQTKHLVDPGAYFGGAYLSAGPPGRHGDGRLLVDRGLPDRREPVPRHFHLPGLPGHALPRRATERAVRPGGRPPGDGRTGARCRREPGTRRTRCGRRWIAGSPTTRRSRPS